MHSAANEDNMTDNQSKPNAKPLTKLQILGIIEAGYGNKFLDFKEKVDETGKLTGETGDTLADFLIRELGEHYNAESSDEDNLGAAIEAATKAKEQLEGVIEALNDATLGVYPSKHLSELLAGIQYPDELTYDQWFEKYRPIKNTIGKHGGFDGCMFETYGAELDFVKVVVELEPKRVWTILEGDGGMFIESGFHFVNRFGYFVTEVTVEPQDENNPIDVESESDDDEATA